MKTGINFPHLASVRFTDSQYELLEKYVGAHNYGTVGAAIRRMVTDIITVPRPPWKLLIELLLAQNRWLYRVEMAKLAATEDNPYTADVLKQIYEEAFDEKENMLLAFLDSIREHAGGEVDMDAVGLEDGAHDEEI